MMGDGTLAWSGFGGLALLISEGWARPKGAADKSKKHQPASPATSTSNQPRARTEKKKCERKRKRACEESKVFFFFSVLFFLAVKGL